MEPHDLVIRGLEGWRVIKMTEVYEVDEGGKKTRTRGFFKDENLARLYAVSKDEPDKQVQNRAESCFVLWDGQQGFHIGDWGSGFCEGKVAQELRTAVIASLPVLEQTLFSI